jgi:cholesterol transport system auxiliary component
MSTMFRITAAAAAMLSLGACALMGGGPKPPPTLLTLTTTAAAPASVVRSANAGEAVTIEAPVIPKELRSVRVPAQVGPTAVAYIKDLQWVDTPDRLFQALLSETVRRTTGRVVLDPRQASLDPGISVSGELHKMGYDAAEQAVIVRFDGAMSTAGGTRVETRRFEAKVPTTADAPNVGAALNQAANQVALEAAAWIGR